MAITVVVRLGSGDSGPSLTFDGSRVVIGRSDGSDVRLPDPSVSLRHASIRAQGSSFSILDEGSTNGTWVGGVKLLPQTPRLVKSGDLVRIGRVWLELVIGHTPATPDLGLATRDLALALVRNAMDAAGHDTQALVRVAEGADIGAELRLIEEGRSYVVGRAAQCDLPLADEDASREHLSIVRRGTHVLVRDLNSRNGVHLGDARLAQDREVVWRPPTMVRVGISVLALEDPLSMALAEFEAEDDESLPDDGVPLPPPSKMGSPDARLPNAPQIPNVERRPEAGRSGAPPPNDDGARRENAKPPIARKPRRAWTAADVVVVTIAVVVIGVSIAGLVWVLK